MKNPKRIVIMIFVLAVAIRIVCFVGLIASDDLVYNRSAYDMASGHFTPQANHQYTRLGLFFPVAAIFKLFGVNEISSIIVPFCCFIVLFWSLVLFTTRYFGAWTGIIAAALYTFLPIEIFHATMLLTDLPSATCIALSGMLLYYTQESEHSSKAIQALSFLAGFLLGWAYLIRETAIFFAVFVCGYFLYILITYKTFQWRWLWFALGVCCVSGFEFVYYTKTTGTPFFRYVAVQSAHNISIFSGQRLHGMALLKRLTLDPFRFVFHLQNFGFLYLFAFAGIIYGLRKGSHTLKFVIGWFVTLFLLLQFGSTSLSAYMPLLLFHRFFVLLSVPGVMIAAWYLHEMRYFFVLEDRKDLLALRLSLLLPTILLGIVNFFFFSAVQTILGAGMLLLCVVSFSDTLRSWFHARLSARYATVLLPALLVYVNVMPGTYMAAKGERPRKGLICERDIRPLLEFPLTHTIYTDIRTERVLEYFYHYRSDDQIRNFDDVNVNTLKNAYIIVNWERLFFLNRVYNTHIPGFVLTPPSSWRSYAQIEGDGTPCVIYKVE